MISKDEAIANIRYLDVEQGLWSSYISVLLVDKKGNIWVGAGDNGVSKYDGINFTNYSMREGLSGNSVTSIIETRNGNIWIGTYNGITLFDGVNCIQFTEKEGLGNNHILSMMEDKTGNLWLGTQGGGITKFELKNLEEGKGVFTHYTTKEGLPGNNVTSCIEDNNGNMWFGTNYGVTQFNGNRFLHIAPWDGFDNTPISALLQDRNGNTWIGSGNGIAKFNGKSFIRYSEKEGLSDNHVSSMIEDKKGNIWISTILGGLNKFDGKRFTHFNQAQGLTNNKVIRIAEDKQGNIWCSTEGGGINKLNDASFSYKLDKSIFDYGRVRPIMKDAEGNLWFGTETGGLFKFDNTSIVKYIIKNPDQNYGLRSILADKTGSLWLGTTDGGGLIRFDRKNFTRFSERDGGTTLNVMSLIEDKNGAIWWGTFGNGIKKMTKNNLPGNKMSLVDFSVSEGLSSNRVMTVFEDKAGNLWFCTEGGGLGKYDGTHLINYTEKEGLFSKTITSIAEDEDGNLWLGTLGAGVCKFDGKQFIYYTEQQGLSNNNVWSVLEDSLGHFWFGTDKGLTLFIPQKDSLTALKNKYTIYNFGSHDGLKAIDFNLRSVCIDNNNRIWWGTGKGVPTFDLNNEFNSYVPRSLSMNFIEINDRHYDFRNLHDSAKNKITFSKVTPFYNYPDDLSLAYDQDHLTFHFSAIDWSAPDKIKYSYRMIGLDEGWSSPSAAVTADYRNLQHDNYEFQVKAIGQSQVWTKPFIYNFTIRPPWWLTWWFKLFVACIALAILFVVIRFIYLYQLRKQKAVLEKKLAVQFERQRISSEMHDDIGAGLSGVRLLTEMTKTKFKDPQSISEIEKIYQSVGDVSARMKEVIWSLNTENDSLSSLIGYLQKQARQMMEHFPCNFSITMPEKIPEIKISGEARRHIYLATKEALHNIIKHSGADRVEMNIACENKLRITIADNGKGMNPQENIPEGNGLKNMNNRMKQINGLFILKNENGLHLTFEIPLN